MEWQAYNRTGRVFAAECKQPAVVTTPEGPVEAKVGDYLVVDSECTRTWIFPGWRFAEAFSEVGRTLTFKVLARLSELVQENVSLTLGGPEELRCVRCGKAGSEQLFRGQRTCPDCQLQIRAEREQARTCQVDGSRMVKQVVSHIIIDRCPNCGGVWFDGGEIEVLGSMLEGPTKRGVPPEVAAAFLTGLAAT